jgi:hypothetical protein
VIPNNSNNQILLHFQGEQIEKNEQNYVRLEHTKMEADPR